MDNGIQIIWLKGNTQGGVYIVHLLFEGISSRTTQFSLKLITPLPIQDYLYLSVGLSRSKLINNYYQFNRQSGEELNNFAGRYPYFKKIQTYYMKREKDQVGPEEFATDLYELMNIQYLICLNGQLVQ
ncbi:hypothetical protein pb186bvf_019043 [Paramecium bursaria]